MAEVNTGADKLWADLADLDVDEVCSRAQVSYESGVFLIPFMGEVYRLSCDDHTIVVPEGMPESDGELELLFLAYLVDAKEIGLGGKWISEKEVPGGSLFFTGPHSMPVSGIKERYGTSPADFIERAGELGATTLDYGDASVAFTALPRLPVAFVLWEEDDEFPPEVTVMFDESIPSHIPVDVVLALVSSVVKFF